MNLLSDEGCHCAEIISALGCYTVVTVVTVILMSVMNHDHIGEKAELTWASVLGLTEGAVGHALHPVDWAQGRVSRGIERVNNNLLGAFNLSSAKRAASATSLRILEEVFIKSDGDISSENSWKGFLESS